MDENNMTYWEKNVEYPEYQKMLADKERTRKFSNYYYWMEWKRFDRKFNPKYQK